MRKNKTKQRLGAMVLSIIMVVGMLPASAMAETGTFPIGPSGEITAFEALEADIAMRSVPLGTSERHLELPDALTVTIRLAALKEELTLDYGEADTVTGSVIGIDEIDDAKTPEEAEPTERTVDSADEMTVPLPVTWASSPEYDGEAAGTYIFTPKLPEGLTLGDKIEIPKITVRVGALITGMVTAFDALPDAIRWQNTTVPEFPKMVGGTVEGKVVQIPVTWEADHDYDSEYPKRGLYVFSAVLGEGYGVADGVECPRMTVYIPQSVGKKMTLMALIAGGGTADSPVEITTATQLAEIAILVNARVKGLELFLFNNEDAKVSLKLMNDIDLSAYSSGEGWIPIGVYDSAASQDRFFMGEFNGNNHSITGLHINRDKNKQGFFGGIGAGGIVKNLGVVNANITGLGSVGSVAGVVEGAVENCYSIGGITSGDIYIGGIVGLIEENGAVKKCYSTGAVSGGSYIGGVAGKVENMGAVENCAALNASVTGRDNIGRVAGSVSVGGILSGNIAFGGMTTTEEGREKELIMGEDKVDGPSKTAAQIKTVGFFEALFGNDPAWTYGEGKLPGFGVAVALPPHIVDGSDPNFRGAGTSGNPYQISSAADLAKLAELVNAGNTSYNTAHYKLMNNLDLAGYASADSGNGWTPIGNLSYTFRGNFDGGNHKITNLTISRSSSDLQGLFGYISGGTVQNLGVENGHIVGRNLVGGVVGYVVWGGTVQNCYSSGNISGTGNHVGGLVGVVEGTVQNCYNSGNISSTGNYVGGLAGIVYGTVQNCYSSGNVSSTGNYVGGLAGTVYGTVQNYYSSGNVSSTGDYVGGLAGYVDGTVQNCYSTGSTSGTNGVGGLVGSIVLSMSRVENCAALNPDVNGGISVGRMVGHNYGSVLGSIAFDGMLVEGVGGYAGVLKTAAEINATGFWTTATGFTADWDTTVWSIEAGKLPILKGIAGQDASMPSHLLVAGIMPFEGAGTSESDPYRIKTAADLAKLGELVNAGDSFSSKYFELQNDLDLSAYGSSYDSGRGWVSIGSESRPFQGIFDGGGYQITGLFINRDADYQGIFGYVAEGGIIKNLGVANVNIKGKSNIGAVAGYVSGTGTKVESCYSTGSISGTNYVGGLVGTADLSGVVQNCYSTSSISGTSNIGGVAGYVGALSIVQNCYSSGNVSGTSAIGGVAGSVDWNGAVKNCAALNPTVCSASEVGRVAGDNMGTLISNYAFSHIPGTWANKGLNAIDGADVTSQTLFGANFWTMSTYWDTAAWDGMVWMCVGDKLPILFVGMAGQSGYPGLHLLFERNLANATVTPSTASFIYNGSQQMPDLTVAFDRTILVKDRDYTIATTSTDAAGTSAGTNAGEVTLTLTGIGSFTGTKNFTYTIEQAKVEGITTTVSNVSKTAYEVRNATVPQAVVDAADLPSSVSVTAESGAATLPITWETATAYNAQGTVYAVTGRLTGNGNVNANDITMSVNVTVTPVTAVNPTFEDTLAVLNSDNSATAAKLGSSILPESGSVTVQGQSVAYTINWNGGQMLDRTAVGNEQTFTGTISYTAPPAWLTLPGDLWVSRKVTVTASSHDGGGGSGGYTPSAPAVITATPEKEPSQPVTVSASITATAETSGAASAAISDQIITDAIAKAQADGKAQGKIANGISVELNITLPKGATSLSVILSQNALKSLVSAGVTYFSINGSLITITFDKRALAEIQKQSTGNIKITVVPNTNLSDSAKKMIGTRPVYDITVGYDSGKRGISFGSGTATVSIPYTLGKNEAVGGLYGVYVDEKGNPSRIAGSAYDVNNKSIIFTTTHFSLYGIGYTPLSAKFADISSHWGRESIEYVVGRGLLFGTTETTFSPNAATTRGMLVEALGRLAGVDAKVYTANSFTDVKIGSAYQPYIEWAYSNGIIQGMGNQEFAPDRSITREEIAVIFTNYAKATGYTLPITRSAATYADASSIGSIYKTAVRAMQQAGIMMGGSDNTFSPKASATRAEVSSMLERYVKMTMDPATAQGWVLSDAGQQFYYKDGKSLTGIQTIGGVTYFFNTDGTLKTGWVQGDDGNWRFYSGNNKTYYFSKDGIMAAGKWLQIDGKWYYFNADGTLAKNTKINEYEVDGNGVRKTK
ncbi:S-layer homology domain-containing protein [Cellulosilyticum sp. I15G10I2]|uniref:S-layer homology domain-containing protein n=1 Tax=Cellulosilyticum sp. I15G10I2 TaxID=1892843 RepID=UPI00085BE922|nr:S-layer homology domain-containing protein [Cellulosilyticum sp. I15G10I2]